MSLASKKTFSDILMPTKGSDSYPKIAIRANEWIRQQKENGRYIGINKMSSEQVRKIFNDEVEQPGKPYLEALAAVQGVSIEQLYEAAGYGAAPLDEEESVVIEAFRGARSEATRQRMIEAMKKILEEDKKSGGAED